MPDTSTDFLDDGTADLLGHALLEEVSRSIPTVGNRVDAHRAWREGRAASPRSSAPSRRAGALRRRSTLAGLGVAASVVAVGIALATSTSSPRGVPTSKPRVDPGLAREVIPAAVGAGPVTVQPALQTIPNTSGISGVVEYATAVDTNTQAADDCIPASVICHLHVTGPVEYSVTPPVGGPHNAVWMTCGVYDAPVPNERAVHDLEHGAVWITYRPDTPVAEVKMLRALVETQKDATLDGTDLRGRYMDLSPWADNTLPAPIVISSWGAQLAVTSPADPRLQRFIDTFRVRPDLTYEAGSSCGPDSPDSGIPLES